MKANIIGYDWETSYLAEDPNCTRTKQVLSDLEKYLNTKRLIVGDVLVIDVADHSFACEMFEITGVFHRSGIVKLEYRGGAS